MKTNHTPKKTFSKHLENLEKKQKSSYKKNKILDKTLHQQKEKQSKKAHLTSLSYNIKPGTSTKKLNKKNRRAAIIQKNIKLLKFIERILFFGFIIFSLIYNPYLLLVIPMLGALIYYYPTYKYLPRWAIWYVKVFITKRNYYQHRRELYNQGSLLFHFTKVTNTRNGLQFSPLKKPKIHKLPNGKKVKIWAESKNLQTLRYKNIVKNGATQPKEYIKL